MMTEYIEAAIAFSVKCIETDKKTVFLLPHVTPKKKIIAHAEVLFEMSNNPNVIKQCNNGAITDATRNQTHIKIVECNLAYS
jgi:hypothetical protein